MGPRPSAGSAPETRFAGLRERDCVVGVRFAGLFQGCARGRQPSPAEPAGGYCPDRARHAARPGVMPMVIVTALYYVMVAYVSLLLIWSLVKSTRWERDVLYILVLIPFLLRLFRLE